MILQALYQLAQTEELVADPDYEPKPVAHLVRIGPGGRLLKEDVVRQAAKKVEAPAPPSPALPSPSPPPAAGARQEEAVKMTPLRKRVAVRLVEAQQNAALLTTFNEIDMSRVIALRKDYQEEFTRQHGIKLGFMSFFVKAAIEALKAIPGVNAELRGEDQRHGDERKSNRESRDVTREP